VGKSQAADSDLTGISVAYSNKISPMKLSMSKRARGAARRNLQNDGGTLKPFGISSRKKRLTPSDPKQNNPNDIGAVIIPSGQGPMLWLIRVEKVRVPVSKLALLEPESILRLTLQGLALGLDLLQREVRLEMLPELIKAVRQAEMLLLQELEDLGGRDLVLSQDLQTL
jgi:hypothetical protein